MEIPVTSVAPGHSSVVEEKLPVTVYLPLKLNQRGGKFVSECWRVEIPKRVDFDRSDFEPFEIIKTVEYDWGAQQRLLFWCRVRSVNIAGRNVLMECEEMPYSKREPYITALEALGWVRCAEPTLGQDVA